MERKKHGGKKINQSKYNRYRINLEVVMISLHS